MVLEKLGDSLKNTLSKISKSLFVDEKLINELVKDIQRALLQSDTNVQLVFDLSKKIKERAAETTPAGITKREHLIKVVYDELTNFLGKEAHEIKISKKPTQIMLVGLFGSGKTTTAGKLAKFYKKRGYKVAVMQTDTWRPAAYEQLEQLAKDVGVDFLGIKKEKDPVNIYLAFEKKLKEYDLVIVDTAGRDALSEELISELNHLHQAVQADEKLLVISADLGQAAQKQAQAFHDTCGVTGVIVTKLEGTAKGGGALSACAVTKAPIVFIGVGEKQDDLELFHPQRFVGKLIGMGDIESLLEKAREVITEENAKDMQEKFLKGDFNLVDLYQQMSSL
ncbi:MAG: signal recognition particle, partial [Candidatus Staskawiczbacteria bacterium RIFCSPHIGHO2_01_FULL_41_41]